MKSMEIVLTVIHTPQSFHNMIWIYSKIFRMHKQEDEDSSGGSSSSSQSK